MALSKTPEKGGLVTGNSKMISLRRMDMIAWASGTEDPWGVVNVLIRQHCSLSVTDTHVVLTHVCQFGLQSTIKLQSNRSTQLISFTSCFVLLFFPGGTRSSASHPAVSEVI